MDKAGPGTIADLLMPHDRKEDRLRYFMTCNLVPGSLETVAAWETISCSAWHLESSGAVGRLLNI